MKHCPTVSFRFLSVLVAVLMAMSVSDVQAQYCAKTHIYAQQYAGYYPPGMGISSVASGTYTRTSPAPDNAQAYSYTATGTQISWQRGSTNSMVVKCYPGPYTGYLLVYIDYDADGIFGSGELVYQQYVPSSYVYNNGGFTWGEQTMSVNVAVPCSARDGITRMRLILHDTYYAFSPCGQTYFHETEDYDLNLYGNIQATFPDDNPDSRAILAVNKVYDGSTSEFPMPSVTINATAANQTANIAYRIYGPLPKTDTVYSADFSITTPSSGTYPRQVTGSPSSAIGKYAGPGGSLNTAGAIGGEYMVQVKTTGACASTWAKTFTIAPPRDFGVRLIRTPQTNAAPRKFRYPSSAGIPVEAIFQNTGMDTIKYAKAYVTITGPSGTVVFRDTAVFDSPIARGVRLTQPFKDFYPQTGGHQVGLYKVTVCTEMIDPFPDDNAFNDCMPRTGDPDYVFEVGYNEEPGVTDLTAPTTTTQLYVNRPFRPEGMFENNGIQDLSSVPVRLTITRVADNVVVYNQTAIIPDIAAGQFNKAIYTFPAFTPTVAGDYKLCLKVEYPGDPYLPNNELCVIRTVNPILSGVYTIGTTQPGPRNFPTIDSATNTLYRIGVGGPVVFEFTDATYTQVAPTTTAPAWDLSSNIIGVSSTNTITFRPSVDRSVSRGSVTVNMSSASGLGVHIGQNISPSNSNAIQRQQYFNNAVNANSAGYITFDGGLQKSLRFTIKKTTTADQFASVFYLTAGATNNVIKNCIIENEATNVPTYANSLPRVQFNSGSNQYKFEPNVRTGGISFTAGITQRDTVNPDNFGNLDTIINVNNKFTGNVINGFGYGVVSIGIGSLIKAGVNEFRGFYNTGTEITDNTIYNVRGAGIYVGNEDGVKVIGNRIYNVGAITGGSQDYAAGIVAGGEARYNNINLVIQRNEISGVTANLAARGIVVEQARNDYQSLTSTRKSGPARGQASIIVFPNKPEHTYICSNVIWGLKRGTTSGSAVGIHSFTTRNAVTDLITPKITTYFTVADSIVNNTISIDNDAVIGAGNVIGIGVQNADRPVVMNNAIAINTSANAATGYQSALLYQGTSFRNGRVNTWFLPTTAPKALLSNKNVFWAPNSDIARVIEISHTSELVSAGSRGEYATINQWRNWTGQDINSPVSNFMTDMEYQGTVPNQKLRVKVTPQPPIGSVLNNNGERLPGTKFDISGNLRGQSGLGYDIGASEFDGRLFVSDLEVIDVIKPAAYRDATGATADAEYIMTKAPVDVTARVRNNGALATTNSQVRVRIYLETMASNNANSTTPTFNSYPEVDRVVTTALASGQSKDLAFGIPAWSPQPYFGMMGYNVPTTFGAMALNVTPRYMIEVSTPSDEFNNNNTFTKVVRFYINQSTRSMVVSARGANTNILQGTPTANDIASRLNSDSLQKALNDLGYILDPSSQRYDYDVFDRAAWPSRSVDYTGYQTMFWSHDLNPLSRTERDDIRNYVGSGVPGRKKNIAISAANLPAAHNGASIISDLNFVQRVLRSNYKAPGTPFSPNYSGRYVDGRTIARGYSEIISRTGFTGDNDPTPALITMFSDPNTSGVTNVAYSYAKADRSTTDSIMGTATASITTNAVYLGVDWRHFARTGVRTGVERVVRGIFDFFETNGGKLVPVQLAEFDAKARGNNVDVFWATASEKNLDRFEVERAAVTSVKAGEIAGEALSFNVVGNVAATGTSTARREYTMTDARVAPGTYVYRLTAVDADGARSASQDVQVTVEGEHAGVALTEVMPNPVAGVGTVTFKLDAASDVQLVLVNTAGEEVATLANAAFTVGEHKVQIDATQLASGSYTLILRSNGVATSKTVTVIK